MRYVLNIVLVCLLGSYMPVNAAERFDTLISLEPTTSISRKFNDLNEDRKFTVDAILKLDKSKFETEVNDTSLTEAANELLQSFYQFKAPKKARKNLKIIRTDGKKLREAISPEQITVNSIADDPSDSNIAVLNITATFPVAAIAKGKLKRDFEKAQAQMFPPKPPKGSDGSAKSPKPPQPKRFKFKIAVARALLNAEWTKKIRDKIAEKLNTVKNEIDITIDTGDDEEEEGDQGGSST